MPVRDEGRLYQYNLEMLPDTLSIQYLHAL
jgi:hypothetical protein